jgi:Chaperone of endosialidase
MKRTIRLLPAMLVLLCVAPLAKTLAVSPPPDGGYAGGNTAEGQNALLSLTTGGFNTAVGLLSLRSDTTGSFNTAIGAGTLVANTANENTALGAGALLSNTTGLQNTASGTFALFSNAEGNANTAIGTHALISNTTGFENTAVGRDALSGNTGGVGNTAVGVSALGSANGSTSTAIGFLAGLNVTTASNVICIGALGQNVSNSCYIGQIFGVTSSGGTAVFINSDGKLGTATSSRRFKEEIEPMDTASEALFALKPVTFRYRKDIDPNGASQFGLVAEDVEKADPDLVVRDKEGRPYSVRYDQVNAMLLNEFLKAHKKVDELGSRVARQEVVIAQQGEELRTTATRQENEIRALTASLKEQAAQLQNVSAQIEMNKSATKLTDVSQ